MFDKILIVVLIKPILITVKHFHLDNEFPRNFLNRHGLTEIMEKKTDTL